MDTEQRFAGQSWTNSIKIFMSLQHVGLYMCVWQMIMIVGLPGSGKTTWGQTMAKQYPYKRYNIVGTDTLIEKMRVMGLPRRNNYHGRWEVLIQKATNCLNKLFQIGQHDLRVRRCLFFWLLLPGLLARWIWYYWNVVQASHLLLNSLNSFKNFNVLKSP